MHERCGRILSPAELASRLRHPLRGAGCVLRTCSLLPAEQRGAAVLLAASESGSLSKAALKGLEFCWWRLNAT